MTDQVVAWLVLAVLVFWSVGAYNRLVRLRSQAITAFGVLDRHLGHYLVLVDEHLKDASGPAPAVTLAPGAAITSTSALAGLHGASSQFDVCLRVARKQALDAGAMAALQTAHTTLQMSWQRVLQEYRACPDPQVPPGHPLWTENTRLAAQAVAEFNRAVLAHNAAIRQFPALLLARLFSFRPAGCL